MKISIIQSNYIPWRGYFKILAESDVFVIYDDMQYTKGDWRNRNYIKTSKGKKWLTIPVKVKFLQKINEVKIANLNWTQNHLEQLKQNYRYANNFKEVFPWVQDLYLRAIELEYLTDINTYFLKEISNYLGIQCQFIDSREFKLHGDRSEKLVNICKTLNATTYISGPAAEAYLDKEKFHNQNITLKWMDYHYKGNYIQQYPPFMSNLSILDLILNEGKNAKNLIVK